MMGLVIRMVVLVLSAYFLGNTNGAITVSNLFNKDDVRTHGSGNAGMTNYLRSYGWKRGGLVAAIDLGKSLLACLLGGLLLEYRGLWVEGALLGGLAVSLGHDLPVLQGFRGGKGILCGLGVILVADWHLVLPLALVFGLTVLLTRYVSLGSCLCALGLPVGFTLVYSDRPWVIVLSWAIGILALVMHRGNIGRLLHGTERKISFHHKEEKA